MLYLAKMYLPYLSYSDGQKLTKKLQNFSFTNFFC